MDMVAGRFRLDRSIGPNIIIAIDTETKEQVAVKFEPLNARPPKLHHESDSYRALKHSSRFPNLIHFGVLGKDKYLVMTLLGPDLEHVFKHCNRKFSLKTVLMLAFQMIDTVEYIHCHSFIHRNISPENFLLGLGNKFHQVHAICFGLSKRFRDSTVEHIPFRENRSLIGIPRYASMNALSGFEQSRRDDLESLGYVLMYFLRGSLPWQGIRAATRLQKFEKIRQMKVSTEALCNGHPPEFAEYFNYVRSLRFDEKPEYFYLKRIFRELFAREGFCLDYLFDWCIKERAQMDARQDGVDAGSTS